MPLIESTYRCPWYWRNGHVQTVWPTLFRRVPLERPQRIRLTTSDGDFLDVDGFLQNAHRAAIVSHGLEGNSDRHYVRGMTAALLRRRWDVFAWNNRGCSGEPNRLIKSYHSGATNDLDTVVRHVLQSDRYRNIALVGFSLGGNQTLKYIGEQGDSIDRRIQKAVAFSVPCDLAGSARRMARWDNRLYMRRFLNMLHEKIRVKMAMFPGEIDDSGYEFIRDFQGFDDRYTAPLNGFKDAEDYWTRNSSRSFLPKVRIPTLLINALDDPFLDAGCYPMAEAKKNPRLFLEMPIHGGHVGFMASREYWSETRAVEFLDETMA